MAKSKKLTYFQPQAGTRHIVIEDYHKHWEEAKPWGWEFRIAHGDSVLKIDLKLLSIVRSVEIANKPIFGFVFFLNFG